MITDKAIDQKEMNVLKRCSIFYLMISNDFLSLDTLLGNFRTGLEYVDEVNISKNLIPMLRTDESIDIDQMKTIVHLFIAKLLQPDELENEFITAFNKGEYKPERLFDKALADRLVNHPMAKWKTFVHRTYKVKDKNSKT